MHVQLIISNTLINRLEEKLKTPFNSKYSDEYSSAINDCIKVIIKFPVNTYTNEGYYKYLQEDLSDLIKKIGKSRIYRTRREESYVNGILCAKSIFHELYNRKDGLINDYCRIKVLQRVKNEKTY